MTNSDCVPMTEESLNLFLIVNVPNPHYSIFTSCNQILSIGSHTKWFIKMSLDSSVMLLSKENVLLLTLQIPYIHSIIS
jgi:hypothetical protein